MTHRFTIPGRPQAWARARSTVRPGKDGKLKPFFFKSSKIVSHEAKVSSYYLESGGQLNAGPVQVTIWAYFPRPKRLMRRADPDGAMYMPGRPDSDNLIKQIGDALNGVAWVDDSLIVDAYVRKRYHEKAGAPRTEVEIINL